MNYINCLKTFGLRWPDSRMNPQKWYMLISLNIRQRFIKINNKNIKVNTEYDKELGVDFPSSRTD